MQQIKGTITCLEGDLEHLFGYVDGLSGEKQHAAKLVLRRAFDMGRSMNDLDRLPAAPPVDDDGTLLLGPELRHHINEIRKVYREIADLKSSVESIFSQHKFNHLHSILRRERRSNTDTSSTEIDIAA